VEAGRFDARLYARLNQTVIAVPPLRERREDIPYLTAAFVRGFAQRFNKGLVGLTPGAERMLHDATWDGNVRQLRTVLERACFMAGGEYVTEADLAGVMREAGMVTLTVRPVVPSVAAGGEPQLDQVEREQIVRMLQRVRGNKAVAARLLGVSRRAFYRQLERYGLHQPVAAESRVSAERAISLERV
jgi:DNA-binding NtrC family response regulator